VLRDVLDRLGQRAIVVGHSWAAQRNRARFFPHRWLVLVARHASGVWL
jgi:hypothetical protein